MKNKLKYVLVLLIVFLSVCFYLTSVDFVVRVIGVYENYFYTKYCDKESGAKKSKLIENSVRFYRIIGVVYDRYIGDEITNKDLLMGNARLAANELEQGNKDKYLEYLSYVDGNIISIYPKKKALDYIEEVKYHDQKICKNKRGQKVKGKKRGQIYF